METPEIDPRGAAELSAELTALAAWYVPEWRPDRRAPDGGAALVELFAGMTADTLRRDGQRLHDHYLTFLGLRGGGGRPPVSAEGLVFLTPRPGAPGGEVPAGTVLYAPADNEEGRVYFETVQPLRAVDNAVTGAWATDRDADRIAELFSGGDVPAGLDVPLFDPHGGENLQRRAVYLSDDRVFDAGDRSELVLEFENRHSQSRRDALPDQFLRGARWQCWDGAGWRDAETAERYGSGLRLRFPGVPQRGTVMGRAGRFLRCLFAAPPEEAILLDGVRVGAQGTGLAPDALVRGGELLPRSSPLPFGERPDRAGTFCVGCGEALNKPGAAVELSLELSFRAVRPAGLPPAPPVQYKNVMKRGSLDRPPDVELEIELVAWEYWNGRDWRRLDVRPGCETAFAASGGDGRRKIAFRCPEDAAPLTLAGEESRYLRARIVQAGRALVPNCVFQMPVLGAAAVGYRYERADLRPCPLLLAEADREERALPLPAPRPAALLGRTLCPRPALCLGLRRPLTQGPVSLLVELAPQVGAARPPLRWEYYAADRQGREGWRPLRVEDGTENLAHTGVVRLEGRPDFWETTLLGRRGYFLRLVAEGPVAPPPVLRGLRFNAVRVRQRDRRRPEGFSVAAGEIDKRCDLPAANLCGLEVWVDELGRLSAAERDGLLGRDGVDVRTQRDEGGRLVRLWVRWTETAALAAAGPEERVYQADRAEGAVSFGDGLHGRLPPPGDSVRVAYSVSAGAGGNLAPDALTGSARPLPGGVAARESGPLLGGLGAERPEETEARLRAEGLSGGRAVTRRDLEALLRSGDANIHSVRCAPNRDRLDRSAPGVLAVAVVPRDFHGDPTAFAALERRARDRLAPLLPASLTRLELFEADYLALTVRAELTVPAHDRRDEVLGGAEARLRRYLDPVTGGAAGTGWRPGELPAPEDVRGVLAELAGVTGVKNAALFATAVTAAGPREVDPRDPPRRSFTVPRFGGCDLDVRVDGDQAGPEPGEIGFS